MEQVAHQGYMEVICVPVVIFKEGVFVKKLLGRVLMLSVSCIDKHWSEAQVISFCVPCTFLLQVSGNPFNLTSDDEDAVVVSTEGVEGVAIAFSLVEG